jgi:hypothetical protein
MAPLACLPAIPFAILKIAVTPERMIAARDSPAVLFVATWWAMSMFYKPRFSPA